MPINWSAQQATHIDHVLRKYPVADNQCEAAARGLLPITQQVDPSSHAVLVKPAGGARFLVLGAPFEGIIWRYHVTTEVLGHYVDSITGTPGTGIEHYFARHYAFDD